VALLSKKAKNFENDIKEENHGADTRPNKRQGLIKALVFVAFVISAIVLIRFTPTKNYITTGALTAFLESTGVGAPVAYIIIYAVGVGDIEINFQSQYNKNKHHKKASSDQ
jgi:uncharacterized membrane protein